MNPLKNGRATPRRTAVSRFKPLLEKMSRTLTRTTFTRGVLGDFLAFFFPAD